MKLLVANTRPNRKTIVLDMDMCEPHWERLDIQHNFEEGHYQKAAWLCAYTMAWNLLSLVPIGHTNLVDSNAPMP